MSKITQYDAKVRKYFDIATFCEISVGYQGSLPFSI